MKKQNKKTRNKQKLLFLILEKSKQGFTLHPFTPEWIGIPAMDVIAYVGVDNGRVGVTGRGQHEFLAMMLG
jgi:DMSO/TMAO reductase YedYZ molybdopterin-dependent catalytic subunit